jgi:hypothetical protein
LAASRRIGMTAPQVNHRAAADRHRYSRSNLAAALEVLVKGLPDPLETRLALPLAFNRWRHAYTPGFNFGADSSRILFNLPAQWHSGHRSDPRGQRRDVIQAQRLIGQPKPLL